MDSSKFSDNCFILYKYEPERVILMHNKTKRLYSYGQRVRQTDSYQFDQLVLKAQPFCSGLIYEMEQTSLRKQVQPKINGCNLTQFGQQELINTFQSIFGYLQKGNSHRSISLDSILVDKAGDIRLKDPRLTKANQLYTDYQSLGLTILQCITFKNQDQVQRIPKTKQSLANVLRKFSSRFIANLWILLNNYQKLFSCIQFTQKQISDNEYKKLIIEFDRLKYIECKKYLDELKYTQQKNPITNKNSVFNIKFNKVNKSENNCIDIVKRKIQDQNYFQKNQNQNQGNNQTLKNRETLQKIFMQKCQISKDTSNQEKNKVEKSNYLLSYNPKLRVNLKQIQKQSDFLKYFIQRK